MITTMILRETSRTFQRRSPFSLLWVRPMGGGPRTFPGGLNKWQWKRLHEKKASEKEKRLIDTEKQLYQARLRSQIRASVSGLPDKPEGLSHSPMSPQDHIKALADRFMKSGAEDLWNADDGPMHSPPRPRPSKHGDSQFIKDGTLGYSSSFAGNWHQKRGYCSDHLSNFRVFGGSLRQMRGNLISFRGNLELKRCYPGNVKGKAKKFYKHIKGSSSSEDDEEDYGRVSSNARWPRFVLEGDAPGSEEEKEKNDVKSVRGFMGSATLGKYDVKVTKRRIVKELEEYADQEDEEGNLAEKIYEIRQEIIERKREEERLKVIDEDEVVASGKRFEDCGISPLTVKALTAAGYDVMTKVQDDTLSFCLEGKDAFVKSRAGTGKTTAFLF